MKKFMAFLLSTVMLLSLAGCSKGGNVSSEEGFDGEKFNLTIACQAEEGEITVLEALKAAYEAKHPEVNIIIKDFGAYKTVREYITAYASTPDKLPMILWMPNDEFAEPAEGGYFIDLRSYYEASDETAYDLYYNSMLNAASYTGEYKPLSEDDSKEYGMWFAPRDYNKPTIVYNKTIFEELGIKVPDTSKNWDMNAFYKFCQSVNNAIEKKAGEDRSYRGYRAIHLFSAWEPVYTTMLTNLGTDGIMKDGTFNLDSAKNDAILQELYDNLYNFEYMIDTDGAFNNGTVAMTVAVRPTMVGYANQLGNDNIDWIPFPGKAVAAGTSGYGITTVHAEEEQKVGGETRKVADIAWDFIKFIITEEGQTVASDTGLDIPILKSLTENGSWRQWLSPDLNHDAFLAGEEIGLTTYNDLKPVNRVMARQTASTFFSYIERVEGGKKEARQEKLADLKEYYESTLQ